MILGGCPYTNEGPVLEVVGVMRDSLVYVDVDCRYRAVEGIRGLRQQHRRCEVERQRRHDRGAVTTLESSKRCI